MSKIRICVDAQLLLNRNKTGIAWCADNLIRELAKDDKYEIVLEYFAPKKHPELELLVSQYSESGIKLSPCKWFSSFVYRIMTAFVPVPRRWFFKDKPDISLFFNYVIPSGASGKTVTFIHDMAYKAFPETVNLKTRRWLSLNMKRSCRKADAIVTISEFSKSEIIKYLDVSPKKIHVVSLGADFDKFNTDYSPERIGAVKNKYGIEGEYFLYLGTIEPRKNLLALIKAYKMLCDAEGEKVPKLVLTGGNGWLNDEIYAAVPELGLKDKVIFTGYVDTEEPPVLMNGAMAFVFPSLYEGFGLPVIEAMACGTPVITADSSSLKEIAEGAALLVDEGSIESIYLAMKQLMTDEKLREELREKGFRRAAVYNWKDAADELKKVYTSVLEE